MIKKTGFIVCIIILIGCNGGGGNSDSLPENNWVRDNNNPVLTGSGTAITNICDPSVIYHDNKFKLWASCVEGNVTYASICYSESTDGSAWSLPEIVFSPSATGWDNQKAEVPAVIYDETEPDVSKRFKMWYGGASASHPDETKIGYAYSADGKNWTRLPAASPDEDGLVMEPGVTIGDAGVVSDPAVVKRGASYYMWFNSFGQIDDILISHAASGNGAVWNKSSANPVIIPDVAWENGGPGSITKDVSHPAVIYLVNSNKFVMWYGSFDSTNNETYTGIGFAYRQMALTGRKILAILYSCRIQQKMENKQVYQPALLLYIIITNTTFFIAAQMAVLPG